MSIISDSCSLTPFELNDEKEFLSSHRFSIRPFRESSDENAQLSPEFREQAVKLYPQSGLSFEQIAEKVGIAGETVCRWVSQHLATLPEEQAKLAAAAAEENKMLRKENARLQEEVTILKKAAAYFAKESIQSSSMPLLKQNVPPIL